MVPAPSASAEARFAQRITREIHVDGTDVVVATADMDMILAMIAFTEPLHRELASAPQAVIDAIELGIVGDAQRIAVLTWAMGLTARHREAVKGIVAVACGQSGEWVGKLLPDRFFTLLLMALQVNVDFFSQALPAVQALVVQVVGAAGIGQAAPTAAT